MNRNQQQRSKRKGRPQRPPAQVDFWGEGGPLPEIEPIGISYNPGALVESLGDPPMLTNVNAGPYFVAAVMRAAPIAAALASIAGVLADEPDDDLDG